MRKPKEFLLDSGERRWRVRFRLDGTETSETFRAKPDAATFAAILDGGGPVEALAWLGARQKQADAQTFAEFFEVFVNQLTGVTPRTRADYQAMHRRYLTALDPLPLALVTRSHVTGIVNKLDSDGLSPKTIKNTVHMLSSVMALAIDEGHIARNPCRRVRLPAARLDQVEARFLTLEEFRALHDATPVHYQPLVAFLFGTGLRWSEATALQCRHVDLDHGTVRVERAWKRIPGGWELGPPKSAKSRRTVNAATAALVAVSELIRKPSDLLFTTPAGGLVRHANFYNRVWTPATEKAGLDPSPRIHDARHSHASWLISDGQSLEAVQDQLGHESILTTRRTYGHLLPAIGVEVGKSASRALAQALADRPQAHVGLTALPEATGHPDQSTHPDVE